jgi:hypothetical protein
MKRQYIILLFDIIKKIENIFTINIHSYECY